MSDYTVKPALTTAKVGTGQVDVVEKPVVLTKTYEKPTVVVPHADATKTTRSTHTDPIYTTDPPVATKADVKAHEKFVEKQQKEVAKDHKKAEKEHEKFVEKQHKEAVKEAKKEEKILEKEHKREEKAAEHREKEMEKEHKKAVKEEEKLEHRKEKAVDKQYKVIEKERKETAKQSEKQHKKIEKQVDKDLKESVKEQRRVEKEVQHELKKESKELDAKHHPPAGPVPVTTTVPVVTPVVTTGTVPIVTPIPSTTTHPVATAVPGMSTYVDPHRDHVIVQKQAPAVVVHETITMPGEPQATKTFRDADKAHSHSTTAPVVVKPPVVTTNRPLM